MNLTHVSPSKDGIRGAPKKGKVIQTVKKSVREKPMRREKRAREDKEEGRGKF